MPSWAKARWKKSDEKRGKNETNNEITEKNVFLVSEIVGLFVAVAIAIVISRCKCGGASLVPLFKLVLMMLCRYFCVCPKKKSAYSRTHDRETIGSGGNPDNSNKMESLLLSSSSSSRHK